MVKSVVACFLMQSHSAVDCRCNCGIAYDFVAVYNMNITIVVSLFIVCMHFISCVEFCQLGDTVM